MFKTIVKGFNNKNHLLDVANMLYNTKINVNDLILEIVRIEDKDKAMKLGSWIIKGIDKTKILYYDVVEYGKEI